MPAHPPLSRSARAVGYKAGAVRAWLAACLVCLSAPVAHAQTITLLLSEPGGIYQEAAQALRQELEQGAEGWQVRQQTLAERGAAGREELVVAVGVKALTAALAEPGTTPVLALMVPRLAYEKLLADGTAPARRRPVSALYLDQPLSRQFQLVRLALPNVQRVGVLLGPPSAGLADDLAEAARTARLELDLRQVAATGEVFPALGDLSGETRVLLLLPDATVVNRGTLQTLFLQTYRERLPVLGYSAALATAGAVLGLYATPAQLGREAALLIRLAAKGRELRLPAARHPEAFSLRINRNVARSLGIALPAEAELSASLAAWGKP